MKAIAVAASLLVILSLAAPAIAYERDVPGPDGGEPAGQAVQEAQAASQRIIDEYAPDPTSDPEDHEDAGPPASDGSDHDEDRTPIESPEQPHLPPSDADQTGLGDAVFCGHIQFQTHDCAPAEGEQSETDESEPEVDPETIWIPLALFGLGSDDAPDGQAVEDTPGGIAGTLEALLQPVQQAGAAAKRAVTDTVLAATLLVRHTGDFAQRQLVETIENIGQVGQKFLDIVTNGATSSEAPRTSATTAPVEPSTTNVAPAKTTAFAMAAVGGIGLLVGAFAVLRRLLGLGTISLLSRIPSKDIMKNDTRASIFDIVQNDPGVSLNEIVSRLGISRNAVAYHLAVFESEHTVVSVKDGKYRRYFVNGGKYVNGAKDVVSTIKNDVTRDVIRFILDHPGAIQKDVCQAVGTSPSATNWHITRLEKVGLVAKEKVANTVRYTPGPSFDKYDLGEFGLQTPAAAPA